MDIHPFVRPCIMVSLDKSDISDVSDRSDYLLRTFSAAFLIPVTASWISRSVSLG